MFKERIRHLPKGPIITGSWLGNVNPTRKEKSNLGKQPILRPELFSTRIGEGVWGSNPLGEIKKIKKLI